MTVLVVFVAVLAIGVVVMVAAGQRHVARQRRGLEVYALERSLVYDADPPRDVWPLVPGLERFFGPADAAISGVVAGRPATILDTRRGLLIALRLRERGPELPSVTIRPVMELPFDARYSMFGPPDSSPSVVRLDSIEFNEHHQVVSIDSAFATEICTPEVMEWMVVHWNPGPVDPGKGGVHRRPLARHARSWVRGRRNRARR